MKKVLLIGLLNLGFISSAFAIDSCALIIATGANFATDDKTLDMILYYKGINGDGISGGIGAVLDKGVHQSAPVYNSHCNNGKVHLEWNKPGFAGELTGNLSTNGYFLTGMTGVTGSINGTPISQSSLKFMGYGS